MPDGFFGKLLFVDLTQGTITQESPDPSLYRDYLGGYGLGASVLYQRVPPGADPLGADNVLGFVPGLLTGTGAPFSGRYMVVAKSPLTGGWGDANSGGRFGPALRSTGLDGLFVSGISPRPVYLLVDDKQGKIELRDAAHLWGLDSVETDEKIKQEVGKNAQVICIGPAGENRALVASIMTDGGRTAGRSGLGAVMGAKRLKAVVALGSQRVPLHDQRALSNISNEFRRPFKNTTFMSRLIFSLTKSALPLLDRFKIRPSVVAPDAILYAYKEYGTCSGVAYATVLGDTPVKNWKGIARRDFPLGRSARISDNAVIQHQTKKYHCRHCPLGCGGHMRLQSEKYGLQEGHKTEYETLAAFGTLLLNDDLESIVQANNLCDRYGLDTISTGAIVAFALECAENGLISREQADGLDLSWGNGEAIVALVEKIAHRQGIGDLLADGVQRAAQKIGPEAQAYAMHAGGQELPMHDSRYEPVSALAYQIDPTPGRHTTANGGMYNIPALQKLFAEEHLEPPGHYEYEGKGALFALMNRYFQVLNSAGLCMFSSIVGVPPLLEWINVATGWDLDQKEMLRIGHRIQVLRHMFNLREGIGPEDVSLPARSSGNPPLEGGPLAGVTLDMETMIREYHRVMGFDEQTGVPTEELLESLGLSL